MEANLKNIYIFATNIKSELDKQDIEETLNKDPRILQWSLDQEDIDCVLRIISENLTQQQLLRILNTNNFNCIPLE